MYVFCEINSSFSFFYSPLSNSSTSVILIIWFHFISFFIYFKVGESTGKAGRGVARHIPGPAANLENLTYKAGSVAAEVQKTRQALNERGDKLGMLEDRTQRMANEAENFSNAAHQLMVRCRERKWYQL